MLFNSYIFVLLFLPLCVVGYFALNRLGRPTLALTYLLGMSLWFYGANNPAYLVLLCSSVLVNYGFYRLSLVLNGE
ncbi:MAG: MBOAT family protein, partial [Oscillospiraceae bacterium]|nr:MBOAT family protein [Oscillospiraceae bacterium]